MRKIAPKKRVMMEHQQGYILLLVLIFIAILLGLSTHFLLRTTEHTRDSGRMRDITESMLLAESAMGLVMGRYFIPDETGVSDATRSINLANATRNQVALAQLQNAISYMYYIKNTAGTVNEINQTQPNILQIVANGEATNAAAAPLASSRLVTSIATPLIQLRINDLFINATFRPKLYFLDPITGLLQESVAGLTWSTESATEKAAVWLEVVQNPANASVIDIFVEAVAEVDGVKSYVQRYVAQSAPSRGLPSLSPLTGSEVGTDRVRSVDH